MFQVVHSDLLAALDAGQIQVVGHQVNCQGVMGAGLARQIRERYPQALSDYRAAHTSGRLILGAAVMSRVADQRWIAHLTGQDRYGRDQQHTDYDALRRALSWVATRATKAGLTIGLPYGIGCGLAGDHWPTVLELIEEVANRTQVEIILFQKKGA